MRLCVLACVLLTCGCSRSPTSTDPYADAWKAFRQGRLDVADQITSKALETNKPPSRDFERLQLLHLEIQLDRGRARESLALLDKNPPSNPQIRMRWMAARADAWNRLRDYRKAIAQLDEFDAALANMP